GAENDGLFLVDEVGRTPGDDVGLEFHAFPIWLITFRSARRRECSGSDLKYQGCVIKSAVSPGKLRFSERHFCRIDDSLEGRVHNNSSEETFINQRFSVRLLLEPLGSSLLYVGLRAAMSNEVSSEKPFRRSKGG
ncbi:MAG: hypothetical protein P8X52_11180, partial [Limibacillus sp.]